MGPVLVNVSRYSTVQIISNDLGNIQISKRIFGNSITEIKCYF